MWFGLVVLVALVLGAIFVSPNLWVVLGILVGMTIIVSMIQKTIEERDRKSDERKLYHDSQDTREG
jgi:hypothetical protein